VIAQIRRRLEQLRADARGGGWAAALGRQARGIFARFVYQRLDEVLIACDLAAPFDAGTRSDITSRGIDASQASSLEAFAREHTSPADVRKLLAYLRCGYRGDTAFEAGDMIGYVWWMDASVPHELRHPALRRLGFELAHDDVYSWDLFLAASHRGGGRARAFYGRHLDSLRQRGFRRALGWVEAGNTPARVLYQKLGYRDVGERASHLFFSRFLVTGRHLFVRNGPRHPTPFDYRPLLGGRTGR
jgi:ribosomal protein S18 acetylase RimI-like enzyme